MNKEAAFVLTKMNLLDSSPFLYDHIIALCEKIIITQDVGLWGNVSAMNDLRRRSKDIHECISKLDFTKVELKKDMEGK